MNWIGILVSTLLFVASPVLTKAAVDHVDGVVDFAVPQSADIIKCRFSVTFEAATGVSRIYVWRIDQTMAEGFKFESEEGTRYLDFARTRDLSPNSGPLLFVFWERGASSIGLSIIGVKQDGRIGMLFDDACRMGFEIIDVVGDEWPDIVAVDGRLGGERFETRVFGYRPNGEIAVVATTVCTAPHRYVLLRGPHDPLFGLEVDSRAGKIGPEDRSKDVTH